MSNSECTSLLVRTWPLHSLHHPYIQEETRPSRWGYPNGLQMMKMTKKISPLTSVYHHHHHHHKARSPRIELFWTEYCASGLTTISNIYQRSHYNYLLPLPLLEDPVEYIYDALCLIYTCVINSNHASCNLIPISIMLNPFRKQRLNDCGKFI